MSDLKPRQIKRSIQRFNDYARDLINSDLNTFDDRLNQLVTFCKTDKVLSNIHRQFMNNSNVDFQEWYQDKISDMGSVVGSACFELPTKLEQKLALQYQILVKVNDGEPSLIGFTDKFFATSSKINSYVHAFIKAIVQPLTREMNYKLEEILDELPDNNSQNVNSRRIHIVENYGQYIQQEVHGINNVVKANISENKTEINDLIEELKEELENIEKATQENLELVKGIEKEIKSESPNKTVITALLNSLPHAGSIASIVSAIMRFL